MDAKQVTESLLVGEVSGEIQEIIKRLNEIPHSFVAISWSSYYDYLFIGQDVEEILGYSYENFTKNGIVFLQSITPPDVIQKVFKQLEKQLVELKKEKCFYEKANILTADGALCASDGTLKKMRFIGTILDFKVAEPESLLIACIYLEVEKVEQEHESRLMDEIEILFNKLKKIYVEKKTKHFELLKSNSKLTSREKEVLKYLSQGFNSKEISQKLIVSFNTVETHRKNLLRKFGVNNTASLISGYYSIR